MNTFAAGLIQRDCLKASSGRFLISDGEEGKVKNVMYRFKLNN